MYGQAYLEWKENEAEINSRYECKALRLFEGSISNYTRKVHELLDEMAVLTDYAYRGVPTRTLIEQIKAQLFTAQLSLSAELENAKIAARWEPARKAFH